MAKKPEATESTEASPADVEPVPSSSKPTYVATGNFRHTRLYIKGDTVEFASTIAYVLSKPHLHHLIKEVK